MPEKRSHTRYGSGYTKEWLYRYSLLAQIIIVHITSSIELNKLKGEKKELNRYVNRDAHRNIHQYSHYVRQHNSKKNLSRIQ